jgi:hypothetical protein
VIQQRPELYDKYVQTLISTLAGVQGGRSREELAAITKRVMAKTARFRDLSFSKSKRTVYGRYGQEIVLDEQSEPNNSITGKSIKEARKVVLEIVDLNNKERTDVGLEPINQGYIPEKERRGSSHFSFHYN